MVKSENGEAGQHQDPWPEGRGGALTAAGPATMPCWPQRAKSWIKPLTMLSVL